MSREPQRGHRCKSIGLVRRAKDQQEQDDDEYRDVGRHAFVDAEPDEHAQGQAGVLPALVHGGRESCARLAAPVKENRRALARETTTGLRAG